ncbi:uncharacterized protein LOC143801177 [Ranitomeya variabilis]|uniref:uncharacterized protein LOC143801177 n=1 Tax=Ranitomeya variabilis TaxID=490064 RepID=UPI004056D0DE
MCEKMNLVVIDLLKALPVEERNLWPTKLPDLVDMYNHIPVNSTNCTPAYLMRGRSSKLPVDLDMRVLTPEDTSPDADWDTERQQRYHQIQECVERSLAQARQKQERDYNQHAPAIPLSPGEQVLKRKRRLHKLDDQWEAEPYTILPSDFDNIKVCLISKDGGETSTAISRDHLKICPDKLREKEADPRTSSPVEEEKMIHTVLGDFPQSWTQINQAIVVPVLTFRQLKPPELNVVPDHPDPQSQQTPPEDAMPTVEPASPPSAIGESAMPTISSSSPESSSMPNWMMNVTKLQTYVREERGPEVPRQSIRNHTHQRGLRARQLARYLTAPPDTGFIVFMGQGASTLDEGPVTSVLFTDERRYTLIRNYGANDVGDVKESHHWGMATGDWGASDGATSVSPDLNPIENLWDQLSHRVEARNSVPHNDLRAALHEEWDAMFQQTISPLVDSRRIEDNDEITITASTSCPTVMIRYYWIGNPTP